MVMVRLICPNLKCRKILAVPSDLRGRIIRCSACGTTIKVPPAAPKSDADAAPPTPGKA